MVGVSVRKPDTGPAVLQPAVTLPALASRIDFFNCGAMTADAVGLKHFFPMFRQRNFIRHLSGIKHDRIFHAVDGFPDVIGADIVVGKVTVDTFDTAVRAGMKPGFELGFHDMTGSAEIRTFGSGHEFGGAEHHKVTPDCAENDNGKKTLEQSWEHALASRIDRKTIRQNLRKHALLHVCAKTNFNAAIYEWLFSNTFYISRLLTGIFAPAQR